MVRVTLVGHWGLALVPIGGLALVRDRVRGRVRVSVRVRVRVTVRVGVRWR